MPRMRKRTKRLRENLLNELNSIAQVFHVESIKFLFSDANLRHDVSVQQVIEASMGGPLPLVEILDLSSISKFRANLAQLTQVLGESGLFSITEDGQSATFLQHKIYKKTKDEIARCTIFVDNLPASCSESWLRNVFSKYGKVDYLLLHKLHGQQRGFAFVEFATPNDCNSSEKAFTQPLPPSASTVSLKSALVAKASPSKSGGISVKRKADDELVPPEMAAEEPTRKRVRISISEPESFSKLVVQIVDQPMPESKPVPPTTIPKKKNRRRRSRGRKDASTVERDKVDERISQLKVYSYAEWERLKKAYKAEQRANFAGLKNELHELDAKQLQSVTAELLDSASPPTIPDVDKSGRRRKQRGKAKLIKKAAKAQACEAHRSNWQKVEIGGTDKNNMDLQ